MLQSFAPQRLQSTTLHELGQVLRHVRPQRDEPTITLLDGLLRPSGIACDECSKTWSIDCPERCAYTYGGIEAACVALQGVDLIFFDSDGTSPWVFEWLTLERACLPRLVFLMNLSLPNHGAWIRERLLALGYAEVWTGRTILGDAPYATMGFSDVRRVRSWALLALTK
eukprot:TRINITY_DN25288_c0_g1_i2.p1 TRINITY_DN25288_c0_g1~~TRINITY_DN25288_c0_g1_i2.p1  ORF type:complete len:169 (-),score=8.32 TRINITY_DN25288_c0_g1_i2:538-1044(-)